MKKIISSENIHAGMHIFLVFILSLVSLNLHAQADVNKLIPLDEMGTSTFEGYTGGLYPNGSNEMPAAFYNDAVEMARLVMPLNDNGKPDSDGKIGVVAIGPSTVSRIGQGLLELIYKTPGIRKEIVFVNGGVGGQDLNRIASPTGKFWKIVYNEVSVAGLTNEQVQVVWFQEDDLLNTTEEFPERADLLVQSFTLAIKDMKKRFPNLKLVYLTGRHTTEYMKPDGTIRHKEPRSYYNGWANKWIIEKQINGDASLNYKGENAEVPLLLWGPYFWTQGPKPRKDGYTFTPDMVLNDGVHPNDAGIRKIAGDLIDFWKNDKVSQLWFLENPDATSLPETENKNISFDILHTEIESLIKDNMQGNLKVVILRDTNVVYNQSYDLNKEVISIPDLQAGTYKYLLKDDGNFVKAGAFKINDDKSVEKIVIESVTEPYEIQENSATNSEETKQKNIV
ncbi:MAG: SGNH/GDSL hydrolase family protein, partial [Chitinophagales bacterium]|nr:SGNH/GDSL hydrolase family protein [Chitinophagales bacterium]